MAKKRKKTFTAKSNALDLTEVAVEGGKVALELAKKGIYTLEKLAHNKKLQKSHPYLAQAFTNINSVLGFLDVIVKEKGGEKRRDDEKKGIGRTKNNKKISKQKTL